MRGSEGSSGPRKRRRRKELTPANPQRAGARSSPRPRELVRANPRPAQRSSPAPVVRSEAAAGGGYGLSRAKKFKKTAPYRGAIRKAYKSRPVKERSQFVRTAALTPEKSAILHTHRIEVARNKVLRQGEARSTGMPERDRRRAAKFMRTDALSKATQERIYHNALALVRSGPRQLPGTNATLNAATADPSGQLAKTLTFKRGGMGDPASLPADTEAKQKAMTTIATRAARAGASIPEISRALTAMEKRHKSPALTVLEQFNRPISAVAGGVKGGPAGAVKGAISNKESFTKILKDSGASKGVALGAGLVLDIALDPTTYLTLGVGRPALAAARKAAEAAAREGVEKGLEKAAIERAAHAAAERTFAAHGAKGIGIKVGLRGTPVRAASMLKQSAKHPGAAAAHSTREVSTSGHLTSRVIGTPAGKVTKKVAEKLPQRVKDDLDSIGQSLIHSYRPRAFSPVEWDRMRGAARSYRAGMSAAERTGEARMRAYRAELKAAKVPAERHDAIIDAVEVRDLSRLPDAERPIAQAMMRDAESMLKAEVKADVRKPHEAVREREGVEIPAAPDVRASKKEVQKARRAAATAERQVRAAEQELARYGGRAEVLSRSVAGAKGEKAAQRAARVPKRVMYHVVRDTGVSKEAKLAAIRTGGLKPSTNGRVFLWDDLARAEDFAKSGGHILRVDVGGLKVGGAEGAATRSIAGHIPPERLIEAQVAGGGHGIREAQGRLAAALSARADALETLARHTEAHGERVALARQARLLRRQAEKTEQQATGYVARYLKQNDENASLRVYATEPGGRKVQSTSLRGRTHRGPLSELSAEDRAKFVNDIPLIMGERTAESGRLRALSDFNAKLAAHGKPLHPDDEIDLAVDSATGRVDPVDMQRFYVMGERGDMSPVWRDVDSSEQLTTRIKELIDSGREVVEVPRETMDAMWNLAKRGRVTKAGGKTELPTLAWDEVTRRWKWLVTQPNPGYHARNLMGDAWNARLGGATVRDVGAALRTITGARRHLDGLSRDMLRGIADDFTPEQLGRMGRTERYGTKRYSDAEVLLLAERHGAIRAGQVANELRQLRRGTELQERGKVSRGLQNFSESREDVMRLATFRRALKRGNTPEEAAAWANKHHFDYSDLTEFEVRALRRMMPFYTFMARNTPLQLASLIQSPGRFATLEKTRDAASEAAGLPEDWALTMPEYVQASVPFAVPRGLPGSTSGGLPMLATPMLPVTDLNNVTPHMAVARIAQSVTPFFKLPIELSQKYDFFYRDKIRKDLVPAPGWTADPHNQMMLKKAVGSLPGVGEPTFGEITDRRSGKKVPAWPWWMDKLARQSPISGLGTSLMTEGRDRRPGDKLVSLTNWATGVRRAAIDPAEARTSQLFEDLDQVEEEIKLGVQRRDKPSGTPYAGKLKELSNRRGTIQDLLAEATSGFAAPYFQPPKRKKKKEVKFGQGSGSRSKFGSGSFGGSSSKFGSGNFGR